MLNVRLAGDHPYRILLFTWLSLVMSMMVSLCSVLFFHEMSWMRSEPYLSQFLRGFLPTLRLTDRPDMTIDIYRGRKKQHNTQPCHQQESSQKDPSSHWKT